MPDSFDFCDNWRFHKADLEDGENGELDDASWEKVILPHTWNADDMAPGQPEDKTYIGPAWYRKHFKTPALKEDERLFLLFEGVANRSSVWVDGKLVGGKNAGFLSFRSDITNALQDSDEHLVAVRADNSFRWGEVPPERIDWERYGGIYRDVSLQIKGPAWFDHKSIRVTHPTVTRETASVRVESRLWEMKQASRAVRVVHTLFDPDGEVVSETMQEAKARKGRTVSSDVTLPSVPNPRLWTPDTPNLYRLKSQLFDGDRLLDEETNPVGFRWMEWDPEKGFLLNDEPTKLCGVNVHQDFPGLGNACPRRFHKRDVELIKATGMNFIRASHYPRNEYVLDLCDELGVMVLEEQPFWHGSLRTDHGPAFLQTVREQMRDMVEQHGNHPSIIAWNTVNEIMLTPVMGEAHRAPGERGKRHRLHPEEWPFARQCLAAMNDELHRADPSRSVVMVIGGNWRPNEEAGLTELADIVAYNGGAMHADVDGQLIYDLGKEKDPDRICMMSEGILNFNNPPRRADWDREIERWKDFAGQWSLIYQRPWFCGGTMWCFADYSAYGTYRMRSMVDYSRVPSEGYHFFSSLWSKEPVVHINGHWSWQVETGTEREVAVFTNGEEAELVLNGKSLGTRKPDDKDYPGIPHPPLVWQVHFEPGELKVRASVQGKIVEDTRVTEGSPAALVVVPENDTILADGKDVAFVRVEVRDGEGRHCYNAFGDLKLKATGAARLCGPQTVELRGGVARFAVRSKGQEGQVEVKAQWNDLKRDQVIGACVADQTGDD